MSVQADSTVAIAEKGASRAVFGRMTIQFALVALLLAAWQFLPGPDTIFWVSSPLLILGRLAEWLTDGTVWLHVSSTLTTLVLGYALGSAAGVATGLLLGFLPRVQRVLMPYVVAVYALPKVALIPLYIVLFGVGLAAKVAVVASAIFFQVFSSTLDGIKSVDPDVPEAVRTMGATNSEIARKVILPAAMPWIFNGLKISVRDAIIYTIVAELFASSVGIGFLILQDSNAFDFTGAFAAIVVLMAISLVINAGVGWLEKSSGARLSGSSR